MILFPLPVDADPRTIGLTSRCQLFTPEHLMLDDDPYHRAADAFRDLELDEETLALDVIDAAGRGGHFLGSRTRAGT